MLINLNVPRFMYKLTLCFKEPSPDVDPAMMTMSERRALFEKNKTAPKPVARFGDAVTPSMLTRSVPKLCYVGNNLVKVEHSSFRPQGIIQPSQQPRQLFAAGRVKSPIKLPQQQPESPNKPHTSPIKDLVTSPKRRQPRTDVVTSAWNKKRYVGPQCRTSSDVCTIH